MLRGESAALARRPIEAQKRRFIAEPEAMNRIDIAKLALQFLGKAAHQLDEEEQRVLRGIADRQPISRDMAEEAEIHSTFWDRLADRVAAVGGSWAFIFGFLGVLVGWIVLNTGVLPHLDAAFDPYPYIFLNLMLSMVAALQAPVIMMSQNRQAAQDRLAAAHDYEVNLRAELEIMRLHEKLDAMRIEHLEAMARQQEQMIALLAKA